MKLRTYPSRLAAGGFILNSGIAKLSAGEETAEALHGMAKGTYPFLDSLPPEKFTRALALSEVALGSALLLPLISDRKAGLGLAAFSGGLLGLYLRTPGMRQEGSLRPSQQGIALAKDVWLLGIALSLLAAGRAD